MMNIFLFYILICSYLKQCLLLPFTILENRDNNQGYISFLNRVAVNSCFNTRLTHLLGKYFHTSMYYKSLSFKDLLDLLQLQNIQTTSYYIFHEDLLSKYIHNIADEPYSFSINFISMKNRTYEIKYDMDSFLNQQGKQIYQHGSYDQFLLECGDSIITSYDVGIVLIYSIKVIFNTPRDRREYQKRILEKSNEEIYSFDKVFLQVKQRAKFIPVEFEVYAIQLGGVESDILRRIKYGFENNFLLASCKHNTILKECLPIMNELSTYFLNDFEKQKNDIVTKFYLPLHSFRYEKIDFINFNFNTYDYMIYTSKRRNDILDKTREIYLFSKRLNHIVKHYPLDIATLHQFNNELNTYSKLLFQNNAALSCFITNDNTFTRCKDRLYESIDVNIKKRLNTFLSTFDYEIVSSLYLEKDDCLPHNVKWEDETKFEFRKYGHDYYVENNIGMYCIRSDIADVAFACFDHVNTIYFIYSRIDDYITIECYNDGFGKVYGKKNFFLEMKYDVINEYGSKSIGNELLI